MTKAEFFAVMVKAATLMDALEFEAEYRRSGHNSLPQHNPKEVDDYYSRHTHAFGAISNAFNWKTSAKGRNYWEKLYMKLRVYERGER